MRWFVLVLAVCSAHVGAQTVRAPAWYLGVQGGLSDMGASWRADFSLSPGVSAPGTLSVKRGREIGVLAGRQAEHTRYELEYQRGNFDVGSLQFGSATTALSATGHYDALTANAYLVEPLGTTRLSLYGGLGAGWGRIDLPQTTIAGMSNSGVAWLARAGLEYNFDEQNKAFVQYTYLGLPRPGSDLARRSANTVSIGYRRLF